MKKWEPLNIGWYPWLSKRSNTWLLYITMVFNFFKILNNYLKNCQIFVSFFMKPNNFLRFLKYIKPTILWIFFKYPPPTLVLTYVYKLPCPHYINICPNSLYVSLTFEWIWIDLPQQKWSTPSKQGFIAIDNWINSLITNETKLFSSEIDSPNHFTRQ